MTAATAVVSPRRQVGLLAAFVVAALAIYTVIGFLARSAVYAQHSAVLSLAALSDLLVSVPLLFYLLIVRPRGLSPLAVLPAVGAGATASKLLLPHAGTTGQLLALCVAPVELAVMAFAGLRLRRYYHDLRQATGAGVSFRHALRAALGSEHAADALYAEFAVVRYGLLWWWRRSRPTEATEPGAFPYTSAGSWGTLAGVLGVFSLIEAPVLHLFVARWSPTAAWLLTASSLYLVLWLWADRNASRARPLLLTANTLHIRAGMRWEADIPLSAIAKVQSVGPRGYTRDRKTDLEMVPGGEAKVLVVLHEPLTAVGIYGIRKRFRRVAVAVDEPEAFLRALLNGLTAKTLRAPR